MLDKCSAAHRLGDFTLVVDGATAPDITVCAGRSCEGRPQGNACSTKCRRGGNPENAEFDPFALFSEPSFSHPPRKPVVNREASQQSSTRSDYDGLQSASSSSSRDADVPGELEWNEDVPAECGTADETAEFGCRDGVVEEPPSVLILRRIEELEAALQKLQSCKKKVAKELLTLRDQSRDIANGHGELTASRETVENLERVILEQAAQAMALNAALAKELAKLESCNLLEEDTDRLDHAEEILGRHPITVNSYDAELKGGPKVDAAMFIPPSRIRSSLRPVPGHDRSSNSGKSSELLHAPLDEPSAPLAKRSMSAQSDDVVELFDDDSADPASILRHVRGHGRPVDDEEQIIGAHSMSTPQPTAVIEEDDDMPVFDDYKFSDHSELASPSHAHSRLATTDTVGSSSSSSIAFSTLDRSSVDRSPAALSHLANKTRLPSSRGVFEPWRLGPAAHRHGSDVGRQGASEPCTPEAPFWNLAKQAAERDAFARVIDNPLSCQGPGCASIGDELTAQEFEIADRDVLDVPYTTREQRLELRDFLCEMVASKKAASLFMLYDVEADPPDYARPPPSTHLATPRERAVSSTCAAAPVAKSAADVPLPALRTPSTGSKSMEQDIGLPRASRFKAIASGPRIASGWVGTGDHSSGPSRSSVAVLPSPLGHRSDDEPDPPDSDCESPAMPCAEDCLLEEDIQKAAEPCEQPHRPEAGSELTLFCFSSPSGVPILLQKPKEPSLELTTSDQSASPLPVEPHELSFEQRRAIFQSSGRSDPDTPVQLTMLSEFEDPYIVREL